MSSTTTDDLCTIPTNGTTTNMTAILEPMSLNPSGSSLTTPDTPTIQPTPTQL